MRSPQDTSDDIRVRPGTGYPFGRSACVSGLAFKFALLLFLNVPYGAAIILPMAALFVGLVHPTPFTERQGVPPTRV